MCDEEMTGTGPVYSLTAKARELYIQYTANHPTIHCNRFLAWEEFSEEEQDEWRKKAMIRKYVRT